MTDEDDVVISLAAGLGYEAERDDLDKPKLLRIPAHFHSVDEMLGAAAKLNLPNALLISEREDGSLVFLDTDLNLAQANWLLDRMKQILLPALSNEQRPPEEQK